MNPQVARFPFSVVLASNQPVGTFLFHHQTQVRLGKVGRSCLHLAVPPPVSQGLALDPSRSHQGRHPRAPVAQSTLPLAAAPVVRVGRLESRLGTATWVLEDQSPFPVDVAMPVPVVPSTSVPPTAVRLVPAVTWHSELGSRVAGLLGLSLWVQDQHPMGTADRSVCQSETVALALVAM